MQHPESALAEAYHRLLPWIRAQFPQLECLENGEPRVYLDNAAGTLVPSVVANAMADAALWTNPQPERTWPPAPGTRKAHSHLRALLADFLNAPTGSLVCLSESTTASLFKVRTALEPAWSARDNVVVTDCDHFANVTPWEWRARWEVRRTRMLSDGTLDLDHLASQVDGGTRVVALPLAGNGLGNLIPVCGAAAVVRRRSPAAMVVVDAVHAAPHVPVDVQALGADAVAFSTYKLYGPMGGVLWVSPTAMPGVVDGCYHVEPHTEPATLLEWGTLNNAVAAGIIAALEYLAGIGERLEPAAIGLCPELPRQRRRLRLAMLAIRVAEVAQCARTLGMLREVRGLTIHGIADPTRAAERVPTYSVTLPGWAPHDLERFLWREGRLQAAAGNHYSAAITRGLGLPGVLRASMAHYNSAADGEALARALAAAADRTPGATS